MTAADDRLAPPTAVDGPRWYAWLYADERLKHATAALLAVDREITASIAAGLDHAVAHARLAWWQDECERLAVGTPRHPATIALREASLRAAVAMPSLLGLVDNARWDLAQAVPRSPADLARYARQQGESLLGTLGALGHGRAAADALADTGARLARLEALAAVAKDARRGRLRIAPESLAESGLMPAQLAAPTLPESAVALLRAEHDEVLQGLRESVGLVQSDAWPALRGVAAWVTVASRECVRAARAWPRDAGALEGASMPAVANAWAAWRSARRALSGRAPPC